MNSNDEKIRSAIAEQAGEWYVANQEVPLDGADAAALTAWLKASPVHVEEFLGVSAIARDLKAASSDPEFSLEAILQRARAAEQTPAPSLWWRVKEALLGERSGHWVPAATTMAACAVLAIGALLTWNMRRSTDQPAPTEVVTALRYQTHHGEQLTQRLADNSVLHLDTDSAVTVRYSKHERFVTLSAGQAYFEVTHQPNRTFRVIAGAAEVIDVGTRFDVRLGPDSTLITVVEGQVNVGPAPSAEKPGQDTRARLSLLGANQQIRVAEGEWPATPIAVDAQRTVAWMQKQLAFDHETLDHVAAEFNRYTTKRIEIATPALRTLQISGVFALDDSDAFVAFLRSLKGVRVKVTETQIRVSSDRD